MGKNTHFLGQPVYGQAISLLDKSKVLEISRKYGGERYVKGFDAWAHVVTMLYAVIMRFESLREITFSSLAETDKLVHLGIRRQPCRSTLSDANARRSASVFEEVYRELYRIYRKEFSSDSRKRVEPIWMRRLHIIDSTTISLFSNALFKGVGRNPKTGRKKGGIKAHCATYANEGVPCDVTFTSAATHDHFMLFPSKLQNDDILAIDRAYIDYSKFEELTERGVVYVTKMKKNLTYETRWECRYQAPDGKTAYHVKEIVLAKRTKGEKEIRHRAWIVTYPHITKDSSGKIKSVKMVSLLTNSLDLDIEDVVEVYHKRWLIELLFKQIKQNFPLRYFYGESANAIKIQIWTTLIANLLLSVLKSKIRRPWSFSNFATVLRIILMRYINLISFFEAPEAARKKLLAKASEKPPDPSLFD